MNRPFLGRGWQFPIRVNPGGRASYVSEETLVAQSIWLILATAKGERQMLPQFGCGIHDFVFMPNTDLTRESVAYQVREALVQWEPRIDVLNVRAESDADQRNLLLIRVDYRIRANNAAHNLVYPFYINEGAGG